MIERNDIAETLKMIEHDHLDIRTVTIGVSLLDCASSDAKIFADKIYSDFSFWGNKQQEQGVTMMTPVKAIKGEEPIITQREKAGRDLFSTAVSKVRQPIESFFNWLNEKTNIQRAMKVRSTSGLLVHTMGKIAIAFIYLIF